MTTTIPTRRPTTLPAASPTTHHVPLTACPVEQRALATASRDLADALTGIAFDARCCAVRQRAIAEFSAGVLRAAQGVATRTGHVTLHRACRAVELAAPVFARDVSAGAPALAGAWLALADLFEAGAGTGHEHSAEDLLACERRFRTTVGGSSFVAGSSFGTPWFADACSPRERMVLVSSAPLRVRIALRLAEDRWTGRRDAVRG